jgi:hypothetical protein
MIVETTTSPGGTSAIDVRLRSQRALAAAVMKMVVAAVVVDAGEVHSEEAEVALTEEEEEAVVETEVASEVDVVETEVDSEEDVAETEEDVAETEEDQTDSVVETEESDEIAHTKPDRTLGNSSGRDQPWEGRCEYMGTNQSNIEQLSHQMGY